VPILAAFFAARMFFFYTTRRARSEAVEIVERIQATGGRACAA